MNPGKAAKPLAAADRAPPCARTADAPPFPPAGLRDRNLLVTQAALGHKANNSTIQYLSFRDEEVDDAVLSI